MSAAFRKAAKTRQREHRERSQPGFRKRLGLLEKKKDYKLRANDYHKKQDFLRALRKKALEKNPDEFYYKMTRAKLQDGVHIFKENKEEVTAEQLKLMRTQDIKYIEMKRVAEAKVAFNYSLLMKKGPSRLRLCGHCKRLAPEYEAAATRLKGIVPLAKVDCTANTNTCNKYGVSGYPTLKIFRDGEEAGAYDGPRTADGIVSHLKKQAGPASVPLRTEEEFKKFISDKDASVVGWP